MINHEIQCVNRCDHHSEIHYSNTVMYDSDSSLRHHSPEEKPKFRHSLGTNRYNSPYKTSNKRWEMTVRLNKSESKIQRKFDIAQRLAEESNVPWTIGQRMYFQAVKKELLSVAIEAMKVAGASESAITTVIDRFDSTH